jgi:flagellar motility protein MotE (MotC chaperone)
MSLSKTQAMQGDLLAIAERCEQSSLDLLFLPGVMQFKEAQLKDQRKKLKAKIQEAEHKLSNVNEELHTLNELKTLKKQRQRDNALTESDSDG